LAAIVDVQPDLSVERRGDQGLRPAHLGQILRFVDCQPPGAGEMVEKQIILHQIAPEGRLGQVALGQSPHELVPRIGRPDVAGGGAQAPE
jgi:hypothetical protein